MAAVRALQAVCAVFLLLAAACSDETPDMRDMTAKIEARLGDETKKLAALRTAAQALDKDERFAKYFAMCPAGSFGKEKSRLIAALDKVFGGEEIDGETCSLIPEVCLDGCRDGDTASCLGLAQALEEVEDEIGEAPGRKAYAFACAAGSAGGCTNRGAGMRNYPIAEDPFSQSEPVAKALCEFQLFELACENDDGWGCTMLGESYLLGLGTGEDGSKAKAAFEKACREGMNEESCDYAKSLMQERD